MKSFFRIIAFLEGLSYIMLISIGLYYKYFLNNELYVKILGMPHGVLFVLYVILAAILKKQQNWNKKDFLIILFASLFPFGTFYVDKKYLRNY